MVSVQGRSSGGLHQVAVGKGGLECSGVTTLLGPGYPPEASMTTTILRSELNCQSHHHHHRRRLQQSVHSDINGSFGSIHGTHVRGATPLHMPPGRTAVERQLDYQSSIAWAVTRCRPATREPNHGRQKPTHSASSNRSQHLHMRGVPGAASWPTCPPTSRLTTGLGVLDS